MFEPSVLKPVASRYLVQLSLAAAANLQAKAIDVKCCFLFSMEPRWREIVSYTIPSDGVCWHTRAFCLIGEFFKDILIPRLLEIRGSKASKISANEDRNWNTEVTLEIGPHSVPSEKRKRQITMMLDPDVIKHYKKEGRGWQTRANATLREVAGLK